MDMKLTCSDLVMMNSCEVNCCSWWPLVLHKKYHVNDPEVFKCTFCKYTVSSQKLLDEHYEARHDPNRPRQHTCYICGKGFHQALQLEKHLVSECQQYQIHFHIPLLIQKEHLILSLSITSVMIVLLYCRVL